MDDCPNKPYPPDSVACSVFEVPDDEVDVEVAVVTVVVLAAVVVVEETGARLAITVEFARGSDTWLSDDP